MNTEAPNITEDRSPLDFDWNNLNPGSSSGIGIALFIYLFKAIIFYYYYYRVAQETRGGHEDNTLDYMVIDF